MAKFPTLEEMDKQVAEKALDEFMYNGKSIREWMQIIASEDAISRQAVIELIEGWWVGHTKEDDLVTEIKSLQPVQPQPKIGHWIMKHRTHNEVKHYTGLDEMGETHTISVLERYEVDEPYCSECGKRAGDTSQNYCCACGAKMEVESNG